ncbi:MAG: hypothetical protein AB7F78_06030 [Hyphomicrobiaceae bacterium]
MYPAYAAILVASSLTLYPGAGDRPLTVPGIGDGPRVEALIDKGPIVELVVACPRGTAILSYSKVEGLFCGPAKGCGKSLAPVARAACR